jgi:glycosyltransferase involved in cell wall biosynthesis
MDPEGRYTIFHDSSACLIRNGSLAAAHTKHIDGEVAEIASAVNGSCKVGTRGSQSPLSGNATTIRSVGQRIVPPNALKLCEGSYSLMFGNSIEQFFLRNALNRISTNSTKKIRPVHGQSAIQISVVIPTNRRPGLLQTCINALVHQSFDKNFYEIIVVSDGDDHETKNLVKSFKRLHPSIYYLQLSGKKGLAAARNLGWQRAWGKLIAFTDDDCLPDKTWLATLYKTYKGEEEIAYAGRVKVPSWSPAYKKNISQPETSEFVAANCCCTKMALEKVGGFDERFYMAWREDSDLEFKLINKNIPVVKIEEAVVIHPARRVGLGVSIKEQKKGIFNALLYKKFPELYRQKIQANESWDYYMIAVTFGCLLAGSLLQLKWLAIVFSIFWLLLTVRLTRKSLMPTAKTFDQLVEVIVTSIVIPLVSVYWQIYGAIKYKALFL